jgi:outer membrane translocation and assembly module TamA
MRNWSHEMIKVVLCLGMSLPAFDANAWAGTPGQPSWSAFPVVMYDSDIGLGIGGKGILKNRFHRDESLDLILFGSSKGEQWTVFTFSIPDFEIRQGKRYPLAFDFSVEYDKLLKSNFFGIGNGSADNKFQFPREFIKIEAVFGRAFTERLIGQAGFRYARYSSYRYAPEWNTISSATPGAGETSVAGFVWRVRLDTRDSQINPQKGIRLELQAEKAAKILGSEWDYGRARLEFGAYRRIFGTRNVLAARFWAQHIDGNAPYAELSRIGDSWTGRGYKADRFLDKAMALSSLEARIPIFGNIGGVLFTDAGRVWPDLSKFDWTAWHSDWGLGLRYYLENFVVRFDAGFSPEGTRIFFNFGQVF